MTSFFTAHASRPFILSLPSQKKNNKGHMQRKQEHHLQGHSPSFSVIATNAEDIYAVFRSNPILLENVIHDLHHVRHCPAINAGMECEHCAPCKAFIEKPRDHACKCTVPNREQECSACIMWRVSVSLFRAFETFCQHPQTDLEFQDGVHSLYTLASLLSSS